MIGINDLPKELVIFIFGSLDDKSLYAASEVCRSWYELIATCDSIWVKLIEQKASSKNERRDLLSSTTNYKKLHTLMKSIDRRWSDPLYKPRRFSIKMSDSSVVKDILIVNDLIVVSYFSHNHIDTFDPVFGYRRHHFDLHSLPITTLHKLDALHILSASEDGSVRLWSLKDSGSCVVCLAHSEAPDSSARAIWADDRQDLIITAGDDKLIKIWTYRTPDSTSNEPRVLQGHTGPVVSLDCDNSILASSSQDGTVRLWDLETDKLKRVLNSSLGEGFEKVSIDYEEDIVIATTGRRYDTSARSRGSPAFIYIWQLSTGNMLHRIDGGRSTLHLCPLEFPLVYEDDMDLVFWTWDGIGSAGNEFRVEFQTRLWLGYYDRKRIIANNDGRLYLFDPQSGSLVRSLLDSYGGSIVRFTCSLQYIVEFVVSFAGDCYTLEILDFDGSNA